MVIFNTVVTGKWLDAVLKENGPRVLSKVLWWIHEKRGHYFKVEYVKHLPFVAGAMIDSHTTAEYWKNPTSDRLGYPCYSYIYIYLLWWHVAHFVGRFVCHCSVKCTHKLTYIGCSAVHVLLRLLCMICCMKRFYGLPCMMYL